MHIKKHSDIVWKVKRNESCIPRFLGTAPAVLPKKEKEKEEGVSSFNSQFLFEKKAIMKVFKKQNTHGPPVLLTVFLAIHSQKE